MRNLILASTSPTRKELMNRLGIPFGIEASSYEEDMTIKLEPQALAKQLSYGKAAAVACKYADAVVIGADTFAVHKGKLLGKPKDAEDAKRILKGLSGKTHDVITGFTIIDTKSGKKVSKAIVTKVRFRRLSESEIDGYIKTGEPMNKAAAYGMLGAAASFVEYIEGDWANIVGLPLAHLVKELHKFGVVQFEE